MYKVTVPVMNRNLSERDNQCLVSELKKNGIDNVLIVFSRVLCNDEMLSSEKEKFIKNKNLLEQNGITVGAWLAPTIGYGSVHTGDNNANEIFTHLKTNNGREVPGAFCPLDDNFTNELLKVLDTIVDTGVKTILFEDDFTFMGGKMWHEVSCCCEKHMQKLCEMLGEDIPIEKIAELVYSGEGNKYRDAFIKLQGDTLRDLCRKIDKSVHSRDKDIRIGLSANASSYSIEGAAVSELAKVIAGETRPFIRTTGAPYWKHSVMLANNIESTRVQRSWCDGDIELLAEGDTYPRPRYWVPSNYLEAFDMITRADGCTDGILKYMIDYNSSAEYEKGYTQRHTLNQKHYEEIERRFGGKKTVGINIFENMMTFKNRSFTEEVPFTYFTDGKFLPLASQWLISDNSIPSTYGANNSVNLAFGENAKYLTDEMMKNGVITDALGAEFLLKKGIDTGITEMTPANKPSCEKFSKYKEYTVASAPKGSCFYNMKLKTEAEILSEFGVAYTVLGVIENFSDCKETYPACFFYENKEGQKFMIYSFIMETVITKSEWTPGLFRNYCRQRQLADGFERLSGKPLPAMCYGNPELYILCKKDDSSMSVGLWNLFADEVLTPEIELDKEYARADFYNCSGKLSGNKIILANDIDPYKFAFFTVYEN